MHRTPQCVGKPLDVDAAVAELLEIAGGRTDLLGEVAGLLLGSAGRPTPRTGPLSSSRPPC